MKSQERRNERLRELPRLRDALAEKTKDTEFAKLFEEDMTALRLGVALCEARERLALTQQDMEVRAGVSQETLSRIERGRMPSLTTLQKIAKALGVQVIVRPDGTVTVEPFSHQRAA